LPLYFIFLTTASPVFHENVFQLFDLKRIFIIWTDTGDLLPFLCPFLILTELSFRSSNQEVDRQRSPFVSGLRKVIFDSECPSLDDGWTNRCRSM